MEPWVPVITVGLLGFFGTVIASIIKFVKPTGSSAPSICLEHSGVITRVKKNEKDIETLFKALDKLVESTANLKAAVEGMSQNASR